MIWTLFVFPLFLLLCGFPVFLVLLSAASVSVLVHFNVSPTVLHQVIFGTLDSFALLAVPFFIFVGEIMGSGGVSRRLVGWCDALFANIRGGLPITSVAACTVFGAISGSSPATVAAIGRITYQPMRDAGYTPQFATGVLTSSGVIANIIPPSVAMILYGASAQESVVKLFTAGILPGLLFAASFIGYIYWRAVKENMASAHAFSWRRLWTETRKGVFALGMPAIILGGIYTGVFSPTEAAGVACVYAIIVTMFIYREVDLKGLFTIAGDSAFRTAQIMVIVACSGVFSWLLTTSGTAPALVSWFEDLNMSPLVALLAINVFLLLVGAVLDTASSILLLTPLLVPIIKALGIDPVHFGIIMTVNLSIGMFTPPFGLNIFVAQAIFGENLRVIYRGIAPYIAISILVLLTITYVPGLSLWLTRIGG
ncbi:TRAP transporter large permease [Cognatishimia sp. SS12]|uniref:TRAP transporter large permease n=1 Tax=Cognatishimia sp. SS12 TaxID=2979465 RepID=UPI00232C3FF9|nr:TRAP transporter large permease [Cognatishimia sp. SS12]MDC0738065.1 TRAP transporter large permease [Cognatishimia sp. SS12]